MLLPSITELKKKKKRTRRRNYTLELSKDRRRLKPSFTDQNEKSIPLTLRSFTLIREKEEKIALCA